MKIQQLTLEKGEATGILIDLGTTPLILITTKRGYVMCGYLNMTTANNLGDTAGKVTGVKTFDDVLKSNIVEISENAKQLGLTTNMTAKEFLNALM